MSRDKEIILEVIWEGPYTQKQLREHPNKASLVLYAIRAPHPMYGDNTLVYIGKCKNGAWNRTRSHAEEWYEERHVGGEIYVASIVEFENWDESPDYQEYDRALKAADDKLITRVEKLLIYALQPAYNGSNKSSADSAVGLRIFNVGKTGPIPFEVSAKYHIA